MGSGEIKARAKAFKQKTAKVLEEEIKRPGLFSERVVDSALTFECIRDPENAPVKVGDKARLIDMRKRVDVFIGLNAVGYVVTNQVDMLRDRLGLAGRRGRSIAAYVIEVSDLTPTFIVRVEKK